jgi:hypothetical protein
MAELFWALNMQTKPKVACSNKPFKGNKTYFPDLPCVMPILNMPFSDLLASCFIGSEL